MSRNERSNWRKAPIHLAVAAVVITCAGSSLASAAPAPRPAVERHGAQAPRPEHHFDWREAWKLMPAGWPATEVMRRAAEAETTG
jgi:hypothetical protein